VFNAFFSRLLLQLTVAYILIQRDAVQSNLSIPALCCLVAIYTAVLYVVSQALYMPTVHLRMLYMI
jgi:hypothetical protein